MINYVYQLMAQKLIGVKYTNIDITKGVIIRPEYMSLCHADQRYYLGKRNAKVMNEKLPMALIHECCGTVVYDNTGTYKSGQKVVLIPNMVTKKDEIVFENYTEGSYFLSSGHDGFMQELINMPIERVVPFDDIKPQIAAVAEFISVAVHGVNRFNLIGHERKDTIGIWGDGSLSYCVASVINELCPNSKIVVVGKNKSKLSHFSFVEKTYIADSLPNDFKVDHAFECAGGEGSYFAIDDIIKYIRPQGTVALMGVSENQIPINTRDILEKGLTFVGCSRSGRSDFEIAIKLMENKKFQDRLSVIIHQDEDVTNLKDIHRVFQTDLTTPFKTVFKWCI